MKECDVTYYEEELYRMNLAFDEKVQENIYLKERLRNAVILDQKKEEFIGFRENQLVESEKLVEELRNKIEVIEMSAPLSRVPSTSSQDYAYSTREGRIINDRITRWIGQLNRVSRGNFDAELRQVREALTTLEDNFIQAREDAQTNAEALQTCENVNTRLQEDIERLTAEDMQRQLSGSSNERTSIHTLEEEMDATFRHSRYLSGQFDNTSEDIKILLQTPDLPESDLSPQEVRQLIENEHAKTLIVIGKMNTAERNLRDLRKAVYGTTLIPSPPLAESSIMGSRRTFDDEVLGHLENLESSDHDGSVSPEEHLYNEESSEFEEDGSEMSLSHHSSIVPNENQNLVEGLRREIAVLKIQAVVRRIRHINPPINTPPPRLNTIWLAWS